MLGKGVINMNRFDDERIRLILNREGERHKQKLREREPIRRQLEQGAREAIVRYEHECEQKRSQAEAQIVTTVQPWLNQLVESELLTQLCALRGQDSDEIAISDPIYYFWPKNAFEGLRERNPFEYIAKLIREEHPDDISAGLENRGNQAGIDEVWRADYLIDVDGLRISRWPTIGAGFGFAIALAEAYQISVPVDDVKAALGTIHPDVFIEFATQIEDGRAQRALEKSVLKANTPVVESGDEYRQREREARSEFLRRRSLG